MLEAFHITINSNAINGDEKSVSLLNNDSILVNANRWMSPQCKKSPKKTIIEKVPSTQSTVVKKPKLIMVTQIPNIIEFTNDLMSGDKYNFEGKWERNFFRIFIPASAIKCRFMNIWRKITFSITYIPIGKILLKLLLEGYQDPAIQN